MTFDLTYGFWILFENGIYNLKIDTHFLNIQMNWGNYQIPSDLRLFSGYKSALVAHYGSLANKFPLPTTISNDSTEQQFIHNGGTVASIQMGENYTFTNNSGKFLGEPTFSNVPYYLDPYHQENMGDSDHIYEYILGANFEINSEITEILFDPETRLPVNHQKTTSTSIGENPGSNIAGFNNLIIIGVIGISIIYKLRKKMNRN
jgi:hypothetical protein